MRVLQQHDHDGVPVFVEKNFGDRPQCHEIPLLRRCLPKHDPSAWHLLAASYDVGHLRVQLAISDSCEKEIYVLLEVTPRPCHFSSDLALAVRVLPMTHIYWP